MKFWQLLDNKMDLDKPDEYKKLDSLGIEKALELFPDQILECYKQAYSANIPQFSPKAIVVSGMGGSSNAGKILQGLFESDLDIPFEVFNDYGLPAWVNADTLVVANSYSGNTEETLSAIESANKIGCKILGVATGGKIGEMIKSGAINGSVITPGETNPSGFPKSGLGVSLGALAGALSKAGVIPIQEADINSALTELSEIRKTWNSKEIAKWFDGYMAVFLGGRPLLGALNAGRNAMCEISRNFTQFYDFPEVNHVLIEATQKPQTAKEKIEYLFFVSKFNNERVLTRYKITEEIFRQQGLQFMEYELKGTSKLVESLELPHFCAWVGFYLSILQDTDPGPEPWIIKLKESLAQPVH
jgi:glucose/mannose-6-phosphate isomerase